MFFLLFEFGFSPLNNFRITSTALSTETQNLVAGVWATASQKL